MAGRLRRVLVEPSVGGITPVWLDSEEALFVRNLPGIAAFKASSTYRHRFILTFDPRYDEQWLLKALYSFNLEPSPWLM